MKIASSISKNIDRIPTRFDDIIKDIQSEKIKRYFDQKSPEIKQGSYIIGNVFGKILDKVV